MEKRNGAIHGLRMNTEIIPLPSSPSLRALIAGQGTPPGASSNSSRQHPQQEYPRGPRAGGGSVSALVQGRGITRIEDDAAGD